MKFNKGKCQVLHVARNNPMHHHMLQGCVGASVHQHQSAGKQLCRDSLRALVDIKLTMRERCAISQYPRPTAPWAALGRALSRVREVILSFCSALVRPLLHCWVQRWTFSQERWAYQSKSRTGLQTQSSWEHMTCEQRVRVMILSLLNNRRFGRWWMECGERKFCQCV